MANGIDSVYDPSDVSRIMYELKVKRDEMDLARERKIKGITRIGSSAYKAWSASQNLRTKEFIDTGKYIRNPEIGPFKEMFTPAGGRVVPTLEHAENIALQNIDKKYGYALPSDPSLDIRGAETIGESVKGTVSGTAEKLAAEGSGWGGGIGTAFGIHELATSDYSGPSGRSEKQLDALKTGLYAGAMVPTPLSPYLMAGASILSLVDYFRRR